MLQGCHEDNVSCIDDLQKVQGSYTGYLSAQNFLARVIGKIVKDVTNEVHISALQILRREEIVRRKGDAILEFMRHVGRSVRDDMLDILDHKCRPSKAMRERDTGWTPAATDIDDSRKAFPIESICQWFRVHSGCKATHGSSKTATALGVQT